MARVVRTREEVAKILEDFVSSRGDAWAWDDFLSFAMEDGELESIRTRCANLDSEFPAAKKGHFCGPKASKQFGSMLGSFAHQDARGWRYGLGEHKAKNSVCFLFAMVVV
jgi:hypothetical protein